MPKTIHDTSGNHSAGTARGQQEPGASGLTGPREAPAPRRPGSAKLRDAAIAVRTQEQSAPDGLPSAIAWSSILLGALTGLVLGLWSFGGPVGTPEWIGPYDALPRRFLRLAHVALFALGMLHLMLARQLAATPISPRLDRLALRAIAFGNVTMPIALVGAALWEPVKYLTPAPAVALSLAFALAAASALRQRKGERV